MEEKVIVKLKDKEFEVRKTMKAFLLFEEMAKKPMSKIDDTLSDVLTIFYCILKVANKDFNYSFDEFVDLIDESLDSLEIFNQFLESEAKKEAKKSKSKKK